LERQKIKKPNQPRHPTSVSEVFTHRDLYVGAVVNFNSFVFHLYDADEYCYEFMENNTNLFPLSDLNETMNRLKRIVASKESSAIQAIFKQHDRENREYIGFETFFSAIKNHLGRFLLLEAMVWFICSQLNTVNYFFMNSWGLVDGPGNNHSGPELCFQKRKRI
jgi:hypothetical protein